MRNSKYKYWDKVKEHYGFMVYDVIKDLPFKYANPLKYYFRMNFKGVEEDDINKFIINYEAVENKQELDNIYAFIVENKTAPLDYKNISNVEDRYLNQQYRFLKETLND